MNVAVVQTDPLFGKKAENIEAAIRLMKSAKADLYVLPELFASGYNFSNQKEVSELAEVFGEGETFDRIQAFAKEHGCFIVYGFPEIADGTLFNSAGIVGHDGTAGCYRKIHLFDREKLFFAPGDQPFRVFATPFGNVGIMVCFDWYYPESARTLALSGAQLIAHPSNLVLPHCPEAMRTRCLENRVFAATANRIGTENRGGISLTYIGQSQITSPIGEILHRSPADKAEIAVQELDLSRAKDKHVTEWNDLFEDRREEMYGGR